MAIGEIGLATIRVIFFVYKSIRKEIKQSNTFELLPDRLKILELRPAPRPNQRPVKWAPGLFIGR
jgi:hypothetical protein